MSGGILVSGCCGFVAQVATNSHQTVNSFLEAYLPTAYGSFQRNYFLRHDHTTQNRPPNQTQDFTTKPI